MNKHNVVFMLVALSELSALSKESSDEDPYPLSAPMVALSGHTSMAISLSDAKVILIGQSGQGESEVGTNVVGLAVVGAAVVGADVVGAAVVGEAVVGAAVVGAAVVGAAVVGDAVVGAAVVGESVGAGVHDSAAEASNRHPFGSASDARQSEPSPRVHAMQSN